MTKKKAFTLIEILVGISIIGLLFGMLLPNLKQESPTTKWSTILDSLNNMITYARQEAISTGNTYRLKFNRANISHNIDLDQEQISVSIEKEYKNPENENQLLYEKVPDSFIPTTYIFAKEITIEKLTYNKEDLFETTQGACCYTIPDGLVQECLLTLSKRNEKLNTTQKITFILNPFLGKFDIISEQNGDT